MTTLPAPAPPWELLIVPMSCGSSQNVSYQVERPQNCCFFPLNTHWEFFHVAFSAMSDSSCGAVPSLSKLFSP